MDILKKCDGFTLLEVIIAFALLGIVMVTFLGMFTAGHQYVFDSGVTSAQVFEAQAALDREVSGTTGGGAVQNGNPVITFTNASNVPLFALPMKRMEWVSDGDTILEVCLP